MFTKQYTAPAWDTPEEIEASTAWHCVKHCIAAEHDNFRVDDVELTAFPTSTLHVIRQRLSLTMELDCDDEGSRELQLAMIRRLRDFLDRVERRL